jgi:hypothetical protein
MANNNLADISVFESIQNDQHSKTGMSSLSVFNSKEELEKLAKYENDIIIEYNKVKDALDKTEKGTPQYNELEKNVKFLLTKGINTARLKDHLYEKDVAHEKKIVEEMQKNLPKKLEELKKAAKTQLESPFD